ncbi:MAG: hypothetical protein HY831_00125 [Candidatus Aenigmarchaeota archaeon]|nr:hypothetical protein [Candidatus Aenigmarchaeota archaeon]
MIVGCGSQLTMKLLRDVIKKDLLTVSTSLKDHVSIFNESFFMENPLESNAIAVIDDKTAERFLPSLIKSSILVICCNRTPFVKFVKMLGNIGYSATASFDNIEDLSRKITKAHTMTGLRFIEVLAPCPSEWDYDRSLTVQVAGDLVESGIWPLFEIEGGKVILGPRPAKLGILEPVHSIQSKYQFDQKQVESNWKSIVQLSVK